MHYNDQLSALWRAHAALLRRYGAEPQAAVLEQCAEDVETELRDRDSALIGLNDAVELTGFSRSHLRRLWRTGKVRPLGTQENPKFYASDLPRKLGYVAKNKMLVHDETPPVNLRLQVARAIVKGEQE